MKTFIIVSLKILIPQCCEPSLHIICTHTPGDVFRLCDISAPLLCDLGATLAVLLNCLHPSATVVSLNPRYLPPVFSLLLRCLFVPLSVVSLFPCYWFEFYLLSSPLLLTCRLVICRSAKLEFCTLPRTQREKKGKRGRKLICKHHKSPTHSVILAAQEGLPTLLYPSDD
ncbi:hypothetical protein PAMP_010133 [Pampus punctatissimus]